MLVFKDYDKRMSENCSQNKFLQNIGTRTVPGPCDVANTVMLYEVDEKVCREEETRRA